MKVEVFSFIALVLAAIPCGLFVINLLVYRPTPRSRRREEADNCDPPMNPSPHVGGNAVSVLIPARNEEQNIRATLESVLASRDAEFEVVVLDDHSTDRTTEIVGEFARHDPRVRLESAPPLPGDWCGKQHACHVLARLARHPLLVFMDADVRLAPDALSRMANFMAYRRVDLVSGVPHQELGTLSERLLIPQIHFILLGYLPMPFMRWTRRPGFSAGCGQLFVVRRDAYEATGGHAMIRNTLHDGVKLPRLFRRVGFRTDLFDATDIASCRMYHTNGETWRGLGKNATEGLAAPGTILPMTGLLLGGQVLPFVLLIFAGNLSGSAMVATVLAGVFAYAPRLLAVKIFRQPLGGAPTASTGSSYAVGDSVVGTDPAVRRKAGRLERAQLRNQPRRSTHQSRMKVALCTFMFVTATIAHGLAGEGACSVPTNAPARIALRDQFDAPLTLAFPTTNIVFLTIADKAGSEQIAGWVAPIKERFDTRVEICGIADVSAVPRLLRGLVRNRFRKAQSHPVMLDWSGDEVKAFGCVSDQVNVFVINGEGRILKRATGPVSKTALREVIEVLDEALGKKDRVATK